MLAGVSVTWYTWLEQGRPINASADVLDALARTLRLSPAERIHLHTLAERTIAPLPADAADEPVGAPVALERLVASLEPQPAYVLGPSWQFLAWNPAQERLFPHLDTLPEAERNLLWLVFAVPAIRRLIVGWPSEARRILAEFRADTAARRDHPEIADARRTPEDRVAGVRDLVGRPRRRPVHDAAAPLRPSPGRAARLRVPAAQPRRVARPQGRAASSPCPATTAPHASPPGTRRCRRAPSGSLQSATCQSRYVGSSRRPSSSRSASRRSSCPTPGRARRWSASRPAACATPTSTTARAASTTTSRSCSATRPPASSRRSGADVTDVAAGRLRRSSTGGPCAARAGLPARASRSTASPRTTPPRR